MRARYAVSRGVARAFTSRRRRRAASARCRGSRARRRRRFGAVPSSSGLSTRRWASAGTATALTSSGVTKSRPASAARQRASLSSARLPRGLAPTARLALSRVAERARRCTRRRSARRARARSQPACGAASHGRRPARAPRRRLAARCGGRASRVRPRVGIAEPRPQQEAVELRLRQGIGALVLDRVLGREHEERPLERAGVPSAVTCRSCIASSSAAWVFGGARLISSARRRLVKIGPGGTRSRCRAGSRSTSR